MNAEQYIAIADTLRTHALNGSGDINASHYAVHAALIRALRERTLDDIAPETLRQEIEREIRPV
jgi:hypothetical protein